MNPVASRLQKISQQDVLLLSELGQDSCLLQIIGLILTGLFCGLLVPGCHGVIECNESASSLLGRDKYASDQVIMAKSEPENPLTCLPAHGLQVYTEATVYIIQLIPLFDQSVLISVFAPFVGYSVVDVFIARHLWQ